MSHMQGIILNILSINKLSRPLLAKLYENGPQRRCLQYAELQVAPCNTLVPT